jgi:hypothetical protein
MFPDKGWDELSFHGRSIAAEAAWRLDADKIVEIEIDDGLQGGAGGGVTQIVRQDVIPGGVFGFYSLRVFFQVGSTGRVLESLNSSPNA